jgi:hypothetical protein
MIQDGSGSSRPIRIEKVSARSLVGGKRGRERMKRTAGLVAMTTCLIVLAACGSTSGAPASLTTPPSTSIVSRTVAPATTSSLASAATVPVIPTPGAEVSVAAFPFDEQTVNWFDTLCTGLGRFAGAGLSNPALSQASVVAAVQVAGTDIAELVSQLAGLPVPTIDGGAELAGNVTAGLNVAATSFPQSAATFAAVDPNDIVALTTARSILLAELTTALMGPFDTAVGSLPPGMQVSVRAIPSCAPLSD